MARIGTEEFALFLPDTSLASAMRVAERVRNAISASSFRWGRDESELTCSFGVAGVPEPVASVDSLLPTAEAALQRARPGGSNVVMAPPGSWGGSLPA